MTDSSSKDPAVRYPTQPGWPTSYPPDDEISLFDIWDALVRRRWLVLGVTAAVTALAVAYALVQPTVYPYRSGVEIGTYVGGDGESRLQFVESPAAVRHKLEEAYVPAARAAVDSRDEPAPAIEVRTDEETATGLFVLYTEARPEFAERVRALHGDVIEDLEAAHERLLAPIEARQRNRLERAESELAFLQRREVERSRIEPLEQAVADAERRLEALETQYRGDRLELQNRIAAKRREAESLEDRRARLEAQLERVDEREALVEQQLAAIRELVAQLEETWMQASGDIAGAADAMTLLTVGGQINSARNQAQDLEERLRVGLPERRDELRANLQDNRRAQQQVADELENLENDLAEREETYERERADAEQALATARTKLARGRADYTDAVEDQQRTVRNAEIALDELTPTQRLFVADEGMRPAGTSGRLIATLGLVLGAMLGVFAAFFAEFVAAARRRHEEESSDAEERT